MHNNLKKIGYNTFGRGLITFTVAEKGELGDSIFVLPDALDTLGSAAFSSCNMKTIQCNKGLKYIGSQAFYSCQYLQSFDMPETITDIFLWTFSGCYRLRSINLRNVTRIGDRAFENCSGLPNIDLSEVTYW